MEIAAWLIRGGRPVRIAQAGQGIERDLEDWIEADPTLVEEGLTVVARQLRLEAGQLDLLARDPAGRWVVVEIKAGALRRETVAQALDYAATIQTLAVDSLQQLLNIKASKQVNPSSPSTAIQIDDPPRDVKVIVVGTERDPTLQRVTDYLAAFGVPVRAVTFEVFDIGGARVLLREVVEADEVERSTPPDPEPRIRAILDRADTAGVGPAARILHEQAIALGLFARPYKNSIMYTPPSHRNRALFSVWPKRGRSFWAGVEPYAEFFPITRQRAKALLGDQGWRDLNNETAREYSIGLRTLLEPTA
jgi:Holliday junction resolvase-like predicted endonuclease